MRRSSRRPVGRPRAQRCHPPGAVVADRDLDAEFERIIAGWDEEAPDPQRLDPQRLETHHPEPSLSPAAQPPTDAASAETPSQDEPGETASEGADPTGSAVALDPLPADPSAAPD